MTTTDSVVPVYTTARDGGEWIIVREIPGLNREPFLRYGMQHQAASVAKELNRWARQERQEPQTRSLSAIAADIRAHWPKVYFGAVPYLDAMSELDKISDMFYADTAESVVRYFLANATTWRGEDARRVKAELKGMLK